MSLDRAFVEQNRASTNRVRTLVARLWDRRVLFILEMSERAGKPVTTEVDIVVNDLSLPLWAAIPPREAVRLALEAAETLDQRLESYPPALR